MTAAIFINEKRYWPSEQRDICPICGAYTHIMFYSNKNITIVKKGKKICQGCIESFEFPNKFKVEIDSILNPA